MGRLLMAKSGVTVCCLTATTRLPHLPTPTKPSWPSRSAAFTSPPAERRAEREGAVEPMEWPREEAREEPIVVIDICQPPSRPKGKRSGGPLTALPVRMIWIWPSSTSQLRARTAASIFRSLRPHCSLAPPPRGKGS